MLQGKELLWSSVDNLLSCRHTLGEADYALRHFLAMLALNSGDSTTIYVSTNSSSCMGLPQNTRCIQQLPPVGLVAAAHLGSFVMLLSIFPPSSLKSGIITTRYSAGRAPGGGADSPDTDMYRGLRLSRILKCPGHALCSFDDPRLLACRVSTGDRGSLTLREMPSCEASAYPWSLSIYSHCSKWPHMTSPDANSADDFSRCLHHAPRNAITEFTYRYLELTSFQGLPRKPNDTSSTLLVPLVSSGILDTLATPCYARRPVGSHESRCRPTKNLAPLRPTRGGAKSSIPYSCLRCNGIFIDAMPYSSAFHG
jgi:hypothetical protein